MDPRYSIPMRMVGGMVLTHRQYETEINDYWNILLGRKELPISNGILSLQESATAMHSRAAEITALIQKAEYDGSVRKGDRLYLFRTGPLRTFMAACTKVIEVGSRRVTVAKMEYDMKDGER